MLLHTSVWQILNMKQMQWSETEIVYICRMSWKIVKSHQVNTCSRSLPLLLSLLVTRTELSLRIGVEELCRGPFRLGDILRSDIDWLKRDWKWGGFKWSRLLLDRFIRMLAASVGSLYLQSDVWMTNVLYTQYMTNPTIVYPVKMEYGRNVSISGLRNDGEKWSRKNIIEIRPCASHCLLNRFSS